MPPNPGWAAIGLTVTNVTTSAALGALQFYGPYSSTLFLTAGINIGDTTLHMSFTNDGVFIPGMAVSVYDNNTGATIDLGRVVSYIGVNLVVDTPSPVLITAPEATLTSGGSHMAIWATKSASSGAADVLRFSSGSNEVLILTAKSESNSSAGNDALSLTGGSKLTLAAGSLFASGGANDALQFGGNPAAVQAADSGRGPVPNGWCFVVTPERFIMIFGSKNDGTGGTNGSRRRFAWCDQENPGAWDYSNVTSQAGFLDVEPASPIIAAISTRVGVLFWTGKKTYDHNSWDCPTSTIIPSSVMGLCPGRRSRCRPLRA